MQKAFVSVPNDWLVKSHEVTNRRGIIEDMPSEGDVTTVVGVLPIAETFGSPTISVLLRKEKLFGTRRTLDSKCSSQLFDKVNEIRTCRLKFRAKP